jgi:cell division protein FtsN
VLAAFGGVVWLAYTQGVARGRSDAPKIIAAQKGPAKVAAGGSDQATPYKGLKIYQQPAPADEESDRTPAPPPQQSPIETQVVPSEPETTAVTPHPQAAVPKPVETKPAQVAKATPPPPEIRTTTTAQAPAPEAAPPPPAPKPVEATPAAAPASAAAGAYVLQIGAYKSEAEADTAWSSYHAKHAGALSGYAKSVKQVDLGAKGTWYRLRVGSFASKDAAAALCSKLTAEGGACFPAK